MPGRRVIPMLCVLAALAWVPEASAGNVAFGALQPDGVMYTRRVESMQERQFRALVRQQADFSCGAAALATILRYGYRVQVDEATVIEGMMGVSDPDVVRQRGFSLLDIKRYVERLGMRGRGYRIDESRLKTLRVPGLVLMNVRGFRHFVVLKQVRGDSVELADPILGNRTVAFDEFLASWPLRAVFIVIGSDFDRDTALLKPFGRADARSLYDRQGPLTDAELMDFGFTHSDLF